MKLLTEELVKRFAKVGSQKDQKDPLVIAKLSTWDESIVWYVTECNLKTRRCYGYVKAGLGSKWRPFHLDKFQNAVFMTIPAKRDFKFKETKFSELDL